MKDYSETMALIRAVRKRAGLTQKVFAQKIGVSRDCVASYETGRSEPPGRVMLKIIGLLNNRKELRAILNQE